MAPPKGHKFARRVKSAPSDVSLMIPVTEQEKARYQRLAKRREEKVGKPGVAALVRWLLEREDAKG